MSEKIVLIGAGSVVFTRGLLADFIRNGEPLELCLVDIDPKALKLTYELGKKMIAGNKSAVRLSATTERKKALRGATVVITTIGVGGRRAWEKDVFIPRKYGIYQPVGDTVMPGGTSRALRMAGAMIDIARDAADICPRALFFNYANPMSVICRAVRKATGVPIVGLCHGIHNAVNRLAPLLGVNAAELKYSAVGINHMCWITGMTLRGEDMFPKLELIGAKRLEMAKLSPELGKKFEEAGTAKKSDLNLDNLNPFAWQLFKLFKAYPVPGDRHLCEYFGRLFSGKRAYFGKTLGVDAYSFEDTIKWGDREFAEHGKIAFSRKPLPEKFMENSGGGEVVVDIIRNIRQNKMSVFSANLPNAGQVSNLPKEAVIEAPVSVDSSGIKPIMQKSLPAGVAGTLSTRFQWAETIVEAAIEGSKEKFIQALVLDGAVNSVDQAARLGKELLAAQKQYLPRFRRI